jgi:hypothetical protein
MPVISVPGTNPPKVISGRVSRSHRMPGHYVGEGEAILDVKLGIHHLTLCADEAGKIMRSRPIGTIVPADEILAEVTGVGTPTWEVFVAYRQSDAPGHAGRIGVDLRGYFGPGQVFKDVDSLPFGVDYVEFIRDGAFAMVVVIGPNWATDPRLQNQDDLHREEITTALKRGITVIPVFVNGASVPRYRKSRWAFWRKPGLPSGISAVFRQNGIEITDKRWNYDIGTLIQTVQGALADSPRLKWFLA